MAPLVWKLRVYWKRYTFTAVASILVARYTAKKFRDNNIVRAYCNQAKSYGEERVASVERDGRPTSPRKVMVFLNPAANKREAKLQFMKYSAPLFFLSGVDVTVVESQKEGHLRSLMNYIDTQTECIVVAGGDGTLMEVFTGLMRRIDAEKVRCIPIGVIPLGRENRFYRSNLSSTLKSPPVRAIGDATMDIIRGDQTTPIHLMEIKPESGRLLYALSSLQWGPLRDAYENRDGFRLFGKLRLLVSHLNVALRRWPTDYVLHLWHPKHCQLEDDSGTYPPYNVNNARSTKDTPPNTDSPLDARAESLLGRYFTPVKAHCVRPRFGNETREMTDEKKRLESSFVSDHLKLTTLSNADLVHKELKVMGFHLSLQTKKKECEDRGNERSNSSNTSLELDTWVDGSIGKTTFIKQGWSRTVGHSVTPFPSLSLTSPHLVLQPHSHTESWISIDGEVYETMPISVTALPSAFRMFTRKNTKS